MRILANYSFKHANEAYSVTFETLGDVPKDKADSTVDELFRLAREAIKRQIDGTASAAPPTVIASPEQQPAAPVIKFKNPSLPATKRQKELIMRLCRNQGKKAAENIHTITMAQASEMIGRMKGGYEV